MLSTDAGDRGRTIYGNQAAQRVLAVLSAFGTAERALGVTELARELGMSKNMVHRALGTLVETGWLTRDASSERYQIGFAALLLAGDDIPFALSPVARAYLNRLHAATGESVFLSVIVGDNRVTIDEIVPPGPRVLSSSRGTPVPLHCTKMSRVLLAQLSDKEIEDYVARAAPLKRVLPIRDKESETEGGVWSDIKRIRASGHVVWRNPVHANAAYAIFPLLDAFQRPHGIVTVGGPRERFDTAHIQAMLPRMLGILAPLQKHLRFFSALTEQG